jgi:hypothetical protein
MIWIQLRLLKKIGINNRGTQHEKSLPISRQGLFHLYSIEKAAGPDAVLPVILVDGNFRIFMQPVP